MRTLGLSILLLAAAAATLSAQQWEVGVFGGGGISRNVAVTAPAGSADAGFQAGAALGAFLGLNTYNHIGGEFRYVYLQDNLKLTSGGASASFGGESHLVHYDVILHTGAKNSPVQFFAALGGGVRVFRGTGTEAAYQPLSQYGYFTKTQTLKPMASLGGGLKYSMSHKVCLRIEFRDYISTFPTEVITPAPGAKFGNVVHDFVPTVGLSYLF